MLGFIISTATYISVDASREVEEGEKSNGSSDDELPKEEQEVGHLVQDGHSNLQKSFYSNSEILHAHHVSEN